MIRIVDHGGIKSSFFARDLQCLKVMLNCCIRILQLRYFAMRGQCKKMVLIKSLKEDRKNLVEFFHS